MNYEDIITTILASITLLAFIGVGLYIFFKFGVKQIELDIKVRKSQIKFYDNASEYLERLLKKGDKNVNE